MNIAKFLLIVAVTTLLALSYVHQQVELLRIDYSIDCSRESLSVLLDQNSVLVYNTGRLKSPLYLQEQLAAKKVSLEVPARWYRIGLAEAAR